MTRRTACVVVAIAGSLMVLAGAATVWAQRGGPRQVAPIEPNTRYDGRFTFIRLRYGPPVAYASQRIPWSHDYPTGERNLMRILNEISYLAPHIEETNILALDDPALFKYPLSYLCEPGDWYVTDEEAAHFRAYLLKGGFLIVDDFRYYHWENFETQMRRILPDVRIFDLDASHQIFHSFFEINSLDEIPNYYDQRYNYNNGKPMFRGIYEDNDPHKRLMVVIAYNTDISEYWEWSGTGFKPMDESNEAFKVGVNFFMYGLTH